MKKKETEFLTEEEAEAILRVPDRRTLQGKRDYAILLTTGLRKAEICGLKIGDLKTYRNQAAYSDAMWPLIPIQSGHPFRSKLATYSDPLWPVIPIQSGHP